MRALFLSTLYSSPTQPGKSPGNTRILHAMRRYADIEVVAPLPFYPEPAARRYPSLHAVTKVPLHEYDEDGSTVHHPRTLHVPRFARALYATLFGASLIGPVANLHRKRRFDALLSAWAYPDGTAAVAIGRALSIPTVVRVMGSDINDYAQKPYRRPQIAWAMRSAARVIAVSNHLKGEVEKLGARPDRVLWIPTGVDATRFFPIDRTVARREIGAVEGAPLIVVPGRLAPEKGVAFFLEALARVPTARAVLVGDGLDRTRLEVLASSLGIASRVVFAGFQREAQMRLYYSAADLVCLPSLEEGWPDVLMESFACGCPAVASDVGGVSEILALTGGGILVKPGDPNDLARRLGEGLSRRWDRAGIACAMKEHTIDRTAREYVAALESACG
jgi:glycosyltransferase involved in cell wall biosynthesis